jgi:choline dehydrogenase-like flavoprotein
MMRWKVVREWFAGSLSGYEQRIIKAFAEVLIPLDQKNERMNSLVEKLEDHLRHFGSGTRLCWRMCMIGINLSAFFYYGKCRTMIRMPCDIRLRYVNAFHYTRWSLKRAIKRFIEAIIFMNYYSLPEVEEEVGYKRKFGPTGSSRDYPSANLIREFPGADATIDVDVCVVGSGAGGAFAAMRLAQSGRRVVVIEEGGFFDASDFGEDVVTMTKKLYRDGGMVNTLGWPPMLVPLGMCVGGTTIINSGTCFRTPDKVFGEWVERYGLSTWKPERMESYYREVEELLEVSEAEPSVQGPSGKIFERGAKGLGVDLKPLKRNATDCCGSGVCCWGCPTNAKKSVQINAIPLALRAGAKLYTRCRAERVATHGRHAYAVKARFVDPLTKRKGAQLTVRAKSIIVSCGTLHTPGLLHRSGIPDPSHQRGHNLTLHPATKMMALMEEDVFGWRGIPQGYYTDLLMKEGIKLESIFLPPAFVASTILTTGKEHSDAMAEYNRLAIFGLMVSDTTRGRVVNIPGGRTAALYTLNREDLHRYQRGISFLAEAFFAAGARKVFPGIHSLPMVTREQGAAAISALKLRNKDLDLQAFHPLGTCRMGADPREAVLDSDCRVYGIDNLFVADGSIFPTALGVNPQMTIMAAALKIADHIHNDYL